MPRKKKKTYDKQKQMEINRNRTLKNGRWRTKRPILVLKGRSILSFIFHFVSPPTRRRGDHSRGRDQLWALKGCSDHIADCSKLQFLIKDRNVNCGEHVAPSESIHHGSRVWQSMEKWGQLSRPCESPRGPRTCHVCYEEAEDKGSLCLWWIKPC